MSFNLDNKVCIAKREIDAYQLDKALRHQILVSVAQIQPVHDVGIL